MRLISMRCAGRAYVLLFAALVACRAGAGRSDAGAKRLACIGDSITFGSLMVADRAKNEEVRARHSYPVLLQAMMGDGWKVENFGVPGATLAGWKAKKLDEVRKFEPDAVVIMLGTNDSKDQIWKREQGTFVAEYKSLIDEIKATAGKPEIWVCLPPPAYSRQWKINGATIAQEVIPAIREAANKAGAPVIDLHTLLDGKKKAFTDGIHPNADGAKLVAETVYKSVSGNDTPVFKR